MDKYERQIRDNIARIVKEIERIYADAAKEAARIGATVGTLTEDMFTFDNFPNTRRRIERLLREFHDSLQAAIVSGIRSGHTLANDKNNELSRLVFGDALKSMTQSELNRYITGTAAASDAFARRRADGLKLSDRVWRYTDMYRSEIEMGLDIGIREGRSAAEMARDLQTYLRYPDKLFRRVRDLHGNLVLSQRARNFHPGRGVNRSSFQNARRLAATETNIAYRTADHERMQDMDFIVGIEVHLSNNHNCKGVPKGEFRDICDELAGRYPKGFKFTGWHPLCYDDQSEVYTSDGWKFFRDVQENDLILSLNPDIRDLEYVPILLNISRSYKGKMVHFHNRSYSQLVTPEHEVLCVSKQDRRTFRRITADKCGMSQPIYRSSEWVGREIKQVEVGSLSVPFRHFAEFMGYWLSDGSLGHKYEVGIAQQDADRSRIYDCIKNMGQNPRYNGGKVEFNNKDWYEYLAQFGKAHMKHVPNVIKESEAEGIRIFLDAFISCDGHIKPPKPFVGSRGNMCAPSEGERTYCTSSRRMADDIGELILKIGRRPSFRMMKTAGKVQQFRNGQYRINHNEWIISECRSLYATQYEKDLVDYEGIVYDLTLARNNTMYIRRNGKCFWGSNCRCFTTTILNTAEERAENRRRRAKGLPPLESRNTVKDVPEGFKRWVADNASRIERAAGRGTLPYFLRDNGEVKDGQYEMREV